VVVFAFAAIAAVVETISQRLLVSLPLLVDPVGFQYE
jgi:hypothetical protein